MICTSYVLDADPSTEVTCGNEWKEGSPGNGRPQDIQ